MYLALRPPWGGAATPATMTDAPAVAVAPGDAGVGRPKKKQRRATGGTSASTDLQGTPEEYEESEPEPPPLTAAERRLEWRGDEVTLPASRIDMAGGGEARALEDTEINATINSQSGGVRDCVIQGATGTDLRATITVKLVVDGSGRVSKSKLQAPHYLFEKGLLGCVQKAVGRMKFPGTGAATLVTLPVNLG